MKMMLKWKMWCLLFDIAKAIANGSIYLMNLSNRKMKEALYGR